MASKPARLKIDHIGITVKPEHWDAAVKAYTEVLGFEMQAMRYTKETGAIRYCFLARDDVYIELLARADLDEGLCEICFGVDDIEAIHDEFKEKGITLLASATEALPNGKKWGKVAPEAKAKFAYIPPEIFNGAYPPMGIELMEWEAPKEEALKTEVQVRRIYGP